MKLARFFECLAPVVGIGGAEPAVLEVVAVQNSRAQIVFDDQDEGARIYTLRNVHSEPATQTTANLVSVTSRFPSSSI